MSKDKLDKKLKEAKEKAVKQLNNWLDSRFTEEISAVKWDFPTPPKVRDIVDTGRLRASQTRVQREDGKIEFSWPVEYAKQVHEGGVGLDGQRFPGRPWTKGPLKEAPEKFKEFLTQAIKESESK